MALLRKLFYRKPPDGLFEICERVYVFDSCFTTDVWEEGKYKVYVGNVIHQLREHFPDASILVFNFWDMGPPSLMSDLLSEYDMTIMDYPRHYEGCPLLPMEVIHHFLRSSESWLSLGEQNVLLMHCERGGWPVLAFMLAALLMYRRYYSGEQRTLDMVYKQAPRELLHLLSPLNPFPSQLRYLQYVSRRNVAAEWPPLDRALTLDCIILRMIPHFDRAGGCRPIFRIYGKDPFLDGERTPKILFSTLKKSKTVRHYKQVECELVKIDINCHIQGDVVLECINLHDDMEGEEMMFRVMFNTAFIRSNILILNRDEVDSLWNAKDQFPKDFRAEVLLSEMDAAASIIPMDLSCFEEKDGLPLDVFATVQEMFSNVDWLSPKADVMRNVLQHLPMSNAEKEKSETNSPQTGDISKLMPELTPEKQPASTPKSSGTDLNEQKAEKCLKYTRETITLPRPSVSQPEHSFVPSEVEDNASSLPVPKLSTYHRADMKPAYPSIKKIPETYPKETSDTDMAHPVPLAASPPSKSLLSTPPSPPPLPAKDSKLGPWKPPSPPAMPMAPLTKHLQDKVSDSLKQLTLISEKNDIVATSLPSPSLLPISSPSSEGASGETAPPPPSISPSATPMQETRIRQPLPLPPPVPPSPSTPLPPLNLPLEESSASRVAIPPPPPPPVLSPKENSSFRSGPSPPPPPPKLSVPASGPTKSSMVSPPPPPPPAPPSMKQVSADSGGRTSGAPSPPPPAIPSPGAKGKSLLSRTMSPKNSQKKKLKPLHWLKLNRAIQGSLWAEAQKSGEAARAPEIDIKELESLFSAALPGSDQGGVGRKTGSRASMGQKPDKVQLIEHRRAYNCEIMLSKVKIPLHDLLNSVLALEDSALDVDQVENLIKFCPTKEEMEMLKGYKGDKDKLGRCEQFFLELMQVPRIESKLRVFSFKIQFNTQVSDLRKSLNIVNSAADQIRCSMNLKRVMQTILSLGNALNQGTARGSAIGFRLDSLLKLTDTRARDKKMTLMHYLCKVLADKLPEVLDFGKDLSSLEPASKIQIKFLAEEMQAISKGLEKIVQELSMSETDGPVSDNFHKALKEFLRFAEREVRSLASLYSGVGRNVDALILYFGEDPARCPFEQVISTLLNFVRMFNKAHEENCKQLELERKKAEKELAMGKSKTIIPEKDPGKIKDLTT